MDLSNKNIKLLSDFANKARKTVGTISLVNMNNNPEYRNEVFLTIEKSGEPELIAMMIELKKQFDNEPKGIIQKAVSAIHGLGL